MRSWSTRQNTQSVALAASSALANDKLKTLFVNRTTGSCCSLTTVQQITPAFRLEPIALLPVVSATTRRSFVFVMREPSASVPALSAANVDALGSLRKIWCDCRRRVNPLNLERLHRGIVHCSTLLCNKFTGWIIGSLKGGNCAIAACIVWGSMCAYRVLIRKLLCPNALAKTTSPT